MALLEEVEHAIHPRVHERKVASLGAIIDPRADLSTWREGTGLEIVERPIGEQPLAWARRFTDGLSSWLIRRPDGVDAWAVFDRPAGSERDLGVPPEALQATLVQRHPTGAVRVVGPAGVCRRLGFAWYHQPTCASRVAPIPTTP